MGDGNLRVRVALGKSGCTLGNRLHAVMQIIDLPASAQLAADRIVQNRLVVLEHKGLNGVTVHRRFLNRRHIPDAGQGHVQGAGNRRGGQGQNVHALGQLLQPLLVRDAEALFLVHNQKAEILEQHVLLQKLVRSHNQIHAARPESRQRPFLLGRGTEAGKHLDVDRKALEAAHCREIVLLRQNRGRNENCDLLGIHHGLHRGAQGDLGFAEAHVAAEQPIHRRGRLHIALDLRDTAELIVRLDVGKVVLKFPLPRRISGKCEAHAALSLGIELNQSVRQILDGGLGAFFGFLPRIAAQLVQLYGAVLRCADVFINQVHLGRRNVEHVRPLIGNFDVILHRAVHLHLLHADVAPDAVVLMDDQIARRQVGEGVELLAVGGFCPGAGLANRLGQKLALGEHSQPDGRILHAVRQRAVGQVDAPRCGQRLGWEHHRHREVMAAQMFFQNLSPAAVAAEDKGSVVVFLIVPEVCHRHVQIAAVGGKLSGVKLHQRGGLEVGGIGCGEEGVEIERRFSPEVGAEAVPVAAEITELSCENAALQQRIELHAQILLPACGGAVEISVVAEDCDAVFGQIIRRRTEFRVDHAQVAVACPEEAVGTQGLQICLQGFDQGCMGRLAPLLPGDQLLQRRAEAVRPAGVEHGEGLRHRQDHRMRNILNPALGQRVKQAHRVDLVSEELHAQRIVHRGAVNVQNPAPDGKLSHALDHLTAGIAALHQPGGQVLQIIEPAGTQVNRRAQQRPMRQGTQRQGLKGGNHQPLGPGHHAVEQAKTLLLPLARGGGGVVKGQLPRRQNGEGRAKKGRKLLLRPAAGQLILTQHQHRCVQIPIQAGN